MDREKATSEGLATFRTLGSFFRKLADGKKFIEAADEAINEAIADGKTEEKPPAPAPDAPKAPIELRAVDGGRK